MYRTIQNKEQLLIAGVMSGTSLDGIDVAFVEISGNPAIPDYRLRSFYSVSYDSTIREQLLRASDGTLPCREVFNLDRILGEQYASAILDGAGAGEIAITDVDAVGLHGQTIFHDPKNGVTVQIGSAAVVSEALQTIVVNDFRAGDVAAGGEGAPLVPFCDVLLLGHPTKHRLALNIGGIANLTWLPANIVVDNLIAFDTGPGNALIDAAMRELRGVDYDHNGELASTGEVDQQLLHRVLDNPWFKIPPPKSTGRELFGEERGRTLAREAKRGDIPDATVIRTLTQATAQSIVEGIEQFVVPVTEIDEVIVSGGGAKNKVMMKILEELSSGTRIVHSDSLGLPGDAKEAICFALLTWARLHGIHSNVPSVTGAKGNRLLGSLCYQGLKTG